MIPDLNFFILTYILKISSFALALFSEAISIDQLGSIAPEIHIYTTFFLL